MSLEHVLVLFISLCLSFASKADTVQLVGIEFKEKTCFAFALSRLIIQMRVVVLELGHFYFQC